MMIRNQFGDVGIVLSNIQSKLFRRSNGFCFFKDQIISDPSVNISDEIYNFSKKYYCFEPIGMYEHFKHCFNKNAVYDLDCFVDYLKFLYPGIRSFKHRNVELLTLSSDENESIKRNLCQAVKILVDEQYVGSMEPVNVQTELFGFTPKGLFEIIKISGKDLKPTLSDGNLTITSSDAEDYPENMGEVVNAVIDKIAKCGIPMDVDTICIALSLDLGYNFKTRHKLEESKNKQNIKNLISKYYTGEVKRFWRYDTFQEE